MEVWKDIEGWEGEYQISNLGRVKSFKVNKNGIIMKPYPINSGYLLIDLMKNGVRERRLIHRLVAVAFIHNDDIDNKVIVNHIDGNKKNNTYTNLEWVTYSENSDHAYSTGLNNGEKWSKRVNQYDQFGNFIKSYNSLSEASNKSKVDTSDISKCCRGKKIQAGGYQWKYNNDNNTSNITYSEYPKIGRKLKAN